MLTPGFKLLIVKFPKTKPVIISWDCIIAWFEDVIELTVKEVLNVLEPALALITAEPIRSPGDILEISKEPASDVNNEVAISGSLGSWFTLIVKSVKLSQSVLDKEIETSGEKSLGFWAVIVLVFKKKPKQKTNVKFNKIWVKFLFIIFILILVLLYFLS